MGNRKIKKEQVAEKKLEKLRRKELIGELLPLGKSFALWIVLVVIVAWDYTNKQWFSMLFVDFTTYLSYALAKAMFIPAKVLGAGTGIVTTIEVTYRSIVISGYPMIVELECSAYHAYLAMISLVVFSKWTNKQKLISGSFLFVALAVINSLRIVMLGVIGRKLPQVFDFMHDYLWNILLVVIIWGLWEIVNKRIAKGQNLKKEAVTNIK
ncbi:MAG: exosortase/archaeosortase family protein [Prolixibacteraceae bacterium]|jgi:exosortase/archaeosortase family protein|nr:exosortase/archaeosortase family protein [Prolixibacteraceae bacterium]